MNSIIAMQNELQIVDKSSDTLGIATPYQQKKKKKDIFIKLDIDENRPRYGNLTVFIDKGPIHISLGPNYLCFLGGFSFFCFLALILCLTVKSTYQNQVMINFTYFISVLQICSYLLVALSNPSVSLREDNPIKQITSQNVYRVCKKCGAELKIKTYHCRHCDVCIHGYDHHCQWISKCIGNGNLYRFYIFVGFTPIYLLIFMGLIMSCIVISAEKMNSNLKTGIVQNS